MRRAVVLFNLGGPDSPEAIRPFLLNLFNDPDIIPLPAVLRWLQPSLARYIVSKRLPRVTKYYETMGGHSPLRRLTEEQAEALEAALSEAGMPMPVVVAMRYWHPTTEEAIARLAELKVDEVILLPLYPQYSVATTGSSLGHFREALAKSGLSVRQRVVDDYHTDARYIEAIAKTVTEALDRTGPDACVLFSAHGLPESLIRKGDPYQRQIERTRELVIETMGFTGRHMLSYQSRTGPVKWIGPYTDQALVQLAAEGVKKLVMVPLGFVSDHLETLYEMDRMYRDQALSLGFEQFERARSLNADPAFIQSLVTQVGKVAQSEATVSPTFGS